MTLYPSWLNCTKMYIVNPFYHASSYDSDVLFLSLGWRINVFISSRNSVRSPVTRVLCDKTKQCTADILIAHERAITPVFWHQKWLGRPPSVWKLRSMWPTPCEKRRLRHISAHNVSTVRDSDKSSIMTNRKSTMGFPTSYRWSMYVTPKSHKEWFKEWFFVLNKLQLQSNKVCYSVFVWKIPAA